MNWWQLLIPIVFNWLLWAFVAASTYAVAIRDGKKPANAGFSPFPVIPIFPIAFFGLALLINAIYAHWGTRLVGGLHAVLTVIYATVLIYNVVRLNMKHS